MRSELHNRDIITDPYNSVAAWNTVRTKARRLRMGGIDTGAELGDDLVGHGCVADAGLWVYVRQLVQLGETPQETGRKQTRVPDTGRTARRA